MENTKNRKLVVVLIILGVVMLFTGLSYAIANFVFQGQRENKIEISGLSFTYKENTALELTKLEPLSDENGMASGNTYTFGVTATSKVPKDVYYYIYFTIDGSNTLLNKYVTFNLTNLTTTETSGNLKMSSLSALGNDNYYAYGSKLTLTSANLTTTNNYRLTIWVNSDYASDRKYEVKDKEQTVTVGGDTFKFKINVKASDTEFDPLENTLNRLILGKNNSNVWSKTPTLTNTYSGAGDVSGLYKSIDGETNSGTTYYFRGNNGCSGIVMTEEICTLLGGTSFSLNDLTCLGNDWLYESQLTEEQCLANGGTYDENAVNNYVSFAGFTWRIIRINENGTIRLLLDGWTNTNMIFHPNIGDYNYMYYSNSDVEGGIKRTVDTWYNNNLKKFENYIADTEFCEQYKVSLKTDYYTAGNEVVVAKENYTPTFKCSTDKNGKGILTSKIGLLTYDEALYAGNYPEKVSDSYITNGNYWYWLMSPAGVSNVDTRAWSIGVFGHINSSIVNIGDGENTILPVISLKSGLPVTGSGTESDPYVIQMS